jgi:hypothetical protein
VSLISTTIEAVEWPCGCWQIVNHSLLHLCVMHQCYGAETPDYWRSTPTKNITLKVLQVEK